MYFITTKRMLEVCFFQHTPTFIIEPKEVAAHSHSNLFFRLKYMLLKVEDQFDFVGMNCAMRPAKSAIF